MADNPVSDLISVLQPKAENKFPRVALGVALGQAAWPVAKSIRTWVNNKRLYTIKIPGGMGSDGLYYDIQEWILGLLPAEERKALIAFAPFSNTPAGEDNKPPPLRFGYDGRRSQTIFIRGHKVTVSLEEGNRKEEKPPEICFSMTTLAAKDAVAAEIAAALVQTNRDPVFRMLDTWGDWERIDELPDRSLESVILPGRQLDRIITDITTFLDSEELYARRCIPWHRGHLYEGSPGTGKTSVARAVASHFGLDVWHLPLADVKHDSGLLRAVLGVKPRSVLLLEDIDVFHAATQRDDKSEITLSGVLNALDGFATPHGLITIMTSNHPEVLDEALIRPGRVDLVEHFGLASSKEISRLLARWYGTDVEFTHDVHLSPATVTEICKRNEHLHDALVQLKEAA